MRKREFLCILIILLGLMFLLPATAFAAAETPADWAWLVAQVASGAESITLPNDITCDSDDGLLAASNCDIIGNGFAITGAILDGGVFVLRDVRLVGIHGVDDEHGGTALTLRGDGTVAALMGTTRAEGGRSGMDGDHGGDGILMDGENQGLIMDGTSVAAGGVGHLYGGAGVRVLGCNANLLLSSNAAIVGSSGVAEGAAGIVSPSCCKITMNKQGTTTGGASPYVGGDGIASLLCEACEGRAPVSLSDMAMAIGSTGQDGGSGIRITREGATDEADLLLSGSCMLIGGDGNTAGAALHAEGCLIVASDTPTAVGGRFFETETAVLVLEDSTVDGEINATDGVQTDSYPASNVSSIINTALSQRSDRYVPKVIEDGLGSRELLQSLNGVSVEKGSVSQANVSGGGLKIFMHNGTLEKRMQFKQHLMDDGAGGVRLVLIGSSSDEWPTIDATVAALRKLESLGVTQLAYTCVPPVYHERVLDIATLLAAIDESEAEVARIMCGTADDAIIFYYEDKTMDYQEELMAEVARPVE